MRKTIASLFVFAVAVVCVGHAQAALTVTGWGKQTDLGGDLFKVVVNVKASEGMVGGFQGLGAGGAAFTGALNQVKVGGAVFTPTQDLNAAINPLTDTQFLLTNAQVLAVTAPFETDNSIGGVFTVAAASRSNDFNMIQLVGQKGQVVNYNFMLAEAIGAASPETTFSGSFEFGAVPEPATMAMAGMGLIGLIAASRRRKA